MSRIAHAFSRAGEQNRAAFVAYLCAGDPSFDTSLEACRALIKSGIDVLELGVPFSDPLADGLTNQLAAQRALEGGMTAARVFEFVRRIREFSDVPVVFYTYYNLVFSNGIDGYVKAAKAAGVDGMLVLDLPPEEGAEFAAAAAQHGVDTVCIVAPTTPAARIEKITAATTGFIYYVSREGVTGVRSDVAGGIAEPVPQRHDRGGRDVGHPFGRAGGEFSEEEKRRPRRLTWGTSGGDASIHFFRIEAEGRFLCGLRTQFVLESDY